MRLLHRYEDSDAYRGNVAYTYNFAALNQDMLGELEELPPEIPTVSDGSGGITNTVIPSEPVKVSLTPFQMIPRYTEESFGQTLNPVASPAIPSQDEARSIVQDFYLRYFGRQPDEAGWKFWSDSFINEIENKGFSFSDALSNLRNAFLVSGEYKNLNDSDEPSTLMDLFNGIFKGGGTGLPTTGGGTGGFSIVPQQVEPESSGAPTQLIIILAVIGIVATIGIHYYFKHHG